MNDTTSKQWADALSLLRERNPKAQAATVRPAVNTSLWHLPRPKSYATRRALSYGLWGGWHVKLRTCSTRTLDGKPKNGGGPKQRTLLTVISGKKLRNRTGQ